jgi:hypothetical protein
MEIGMLWFDDDTQRDLTEKVLRAVAYYRSKYGATPNLCFVNAASLPDGPAVTAGVQLRPEHTVQPHYFWLGRGEA